MTRFENDSHKSRAICAINPHSFYWFPFMEPHPLPPPPVPCCLCPVQGNIGLYIDAAAHADAHFWRQSSTSSASDIAKVYLQLEAPGPAKDVCGLEFAVLLSVAVRLAALLQFIAVWESRDRAALPLAWLRFQLGDGHALFENVVAAVKAALSTQGWTTVKEMSATVIMLWTEVRKQLTLPAGTVCPIVVDEAQILAETDYSHITDTAVRSPFLRSTVGLRCKIRLSCGSPSVCRDVRCFVCVHVQKTWKAVTVVCNVLAGVSSARIILCGTAMTLGLHSWPASAVGRNSTGARCEPAALGSHLLAWNQASASQDLQHFIARRGPKGADAGAADDLDISDVADLFPCACPERWFSSEVNKILLVCVFDLPRGVRNGRFLTIDGAGG